MTDSAITPATTPRPQASAYGCSLLLREEAAR
jgi:hypothetical protein